MPPVFTCCVVNCDADAKNTRKHRFPKDPVLFRKWIEFSQRTNLENMDVEKVRNNYRICDYYFAPEYIVGVQHFSISGLVTGAISTLNSSSYVELDLSSAFVSNIEQSSVKDASTSVTDTALNRLSENFVKVVEILKGSDSIETANAVNKVNTVMDKLKTPGDVLSFLHQIKKIKRGRIIGVQPTSTSRRKHRAGLTAGSKRIQAGRPSKFEGGIVKKKKCLRNLEANIKLNQTNQKSH
ncbi:hypothetical protein FQR65_LT15998 [Abscondita terminalis]|nr:hypothetical protein FQR65_LT15998 [Abscondita terminalis]